MSQNQTLRTHAISAGRDYQELPAWQKSIALAERVYGLAEDHNGLVKHMRETALVIAASIAAASGRHNEFGMTDSYSKAQSANAELMTQFTLAQRLGYLDQEIVTELLTLSDEIARLIVGLKHGLKVAAKDKENAEKDAAKADRDRKAERYERPRREFRPRDGAGEDRPRREYKARDGGDAPRREYKPRDGGSDAPRREYKPRDSGDAPRREYKPRDTAGGEERPRREYKPRDGASSDRKPYGDKKPYGDRKPYGDKKPYGDRKPSGGKPFRKPRD
jgi:four helix bundle protein